MRALTDFLVVLAGFAILGGAIAFGNWLGGQPLFGWLAFGSILAISIWGTIALARSK